MPVSKYVQETPVYSRETGERIYFVNFDTGKKLIADAEDPNSNVYKKGNKKKKTQIVEKLQTEIQQEMLGTKVITPDWTSPAYSSTPTAKTLNAFQSGQLKSDQPMAVNSQGEVGSIKALETLQRVREQEYTQQLKKEEDARYRERLNQLQAIDKQQKQQHALLRLKPASDIIKQPETKTILYPQPIDKIISPLTGSYVLQPTKVYQVEVKPNQSELPENLKPKTFIGESKKALNFWNTKVSQVTYPLIGEPTEQIGNDITNLGNKMTITGAKPVLKVGGEVISGIGNYVGKKPVSAIATYYSSVAGGYVFSSGFKTLANLKWVGKPLAQGLETGTGIVLGGLFGKSIYDAQKLSPEERKMFYGEAVVGTVGFIKGAKSSKPLFRYEKAVKGSKVNIFEDIGKSKTGKTIKNVQIQFTDIIYGKEKFKWVWEKSIPVRKSIPIIGTMVTRQNITPIGYDISTAEVTGKIKIGGTGGNKIKPSIIDIKEISPPAPVIETSVGFTGTTKAGTPLKRKTPKIRPTTGVEVSIQQRQAYQYYKVKSAEIVVTSRKPYTTNINTAIQKIKVPESAKPKGVVTSSRLYRNKPIERVNLLAERQTQGSIYTKTRVKAEPKVNIKGKGIKRDVNTIFEKNVEPIKQQSFGKSKQELITESLTKQQSKVKKVNIGRIVTPTLKTNTIFTPLVSVNAQEQTQAPKTLFRESQGQIGDSRFTNMFKQNQTPISQSRFTNIFKQEQKITPIQKQTITLEQNSIQQQKQVVGMQQIQTTEQRQLFGRITPIKTSPKIPLVLFPKFGGFGGASKKESGYNVYMREYGKKVKANTKPLPREEATRLGMDIADNSLSASFIVSKTNSKVPSANRIGAGMNPYSSKFITSKRRFGWFNEKRGSRLDSFGEKQGITAAKLISNRRKGIFG
jgi:hypothetical protein